MGYPWYSTREGNAGKNGQFKISLERNCETKEIRFVATLVDHSKRTGRKSMSSIDITELYNKLEKYLNTMETKQDGLLSDITEVFNIYGLTIENEETPEQIEEVTTSPEERFMNDEKISNVEFIELLNKYGIELNYSLHKWITEKLELIGLGQYTYKAAFKGSFPSELSNFVDELYDAIKANETEEKTTDNKDQSNEHIEMNYTKQSNNTFKVNKEKEIIVVRGYMGKVEEIEAQKINHPELELYLYKSSKYYEIYEKKTGRTLVSPKDTKKEVMEVLEKTLNNYYDKLIEAITKTIEKDGYITEYKIGSWIRSA